MLLVVNKPKNYTSHDIVAIVRKRLNVKRVGHAGTLDPLATGVLLILVGREETKKQAQYMAGEKEYVAEVTLGQTSATDDAEGPFTAGQDPTQVTREQIENVLQTFIGEIQQTPPAFSAIQIGGKRLYKIARNIRNTDNADKIHDYTDKMQIPERTVTVHDIELLEYNSPVLKIKVQCGKGTYIRSLARDIGAKLGVGAYMSELTRTKVGEYSLEQAIELEEIKLVIQPPYMIV